MALFTLLYDYFGYCHMFQETFLLQKGDLLDIVQQTVEDNYII
jgi:hypothetical protein